MNIPTSWRVRALLVLVLTASGCHDSESSQSTGRGSPNSAKITLPLASRTANGVASSGAAEVGPAERYFGDAELIDQNGVQRRFFSDLLAGHVVVINSFFSSCGGSCPVMAGTLAKLQKHLGARLGREVVIVSISVDPEHDTPDKLKQWAQRYGAQPGWYLLGGEPARVNAVLSKLGQAVEAPDNHSPVMLIGNVDTGLWKKVFGLGNAKDVIAAVDEVLSDGAPQARRQTIEQ